MADATSIYEYWSHTDLVDLIRRYPLAWIVPQATDAAAMLCPMLIECDADGKPSSLLGHLPKRHSLASVFRPEGLATFLFLGPHGYVSPEHLSDKNWAPTWNYASAQLVCSVRLDDRLTKEALETLVRHMEKDRPAPWDIAALGERYGVLRSRVIGFRAQIIRTRAKFKLGQDETQTAFGEIAAGFEDADLVRWMKRFRDPD